MCDGVLFHRTDLRVFDAAGEDSVRAVDLGGIYAYISFRRTGDPVVSEPSRSIGGDPAVSEPSRGEDIIRREERMRKRQRTEDAGTGTGGFGFIKGVAYGKEDAGV